MADWNDPQTWAGAYRIRGGRPNKTDSILPIGEGFGEYLSYLDGRKFQLQLSDDGEPGLAHLRFNLQKLGATGISPAAETLVVGCGFGWLLEVIVDAQSNAIWGCDNGTLIQSLKSDPQVGVRSDIQDLILNVDFTAVDAADQFKALGAGTNKGLFRNVITEHVLEDWPTADLSSALDSCEALLAAGQSNVYHLVIAQDEVASDSAYMVNRLLLSEWAALRPAHFWVDEVTGNIAGGQ